MRVFVFIISLSIFPAHALEIHSKLCLYGCPFGSSQSNDLIIRDIYILSSNDRTKFADWVAYKITPDSIGRSGKRVWQTDSYLDENETLERDDYTRANAVLKTDRGHQAPLASFMGTDSWKDTNILSNITPQKSNLNQGAWVKLENAVRELVKSRDDAVYVMTGPLYERHMGFMPGADEDHVVPSAYWKIVSYEIDGTIHVTGFIFEQALERDAKQCDQITTVQEIEDRSQLLFFHAPNTNIQETILDLCG